MASQFITVVLASTSKCYQLCVTDGFTVSQVSWGVTTLNKVNTLPTYGLHIHTELSCVLYSLLN